MTETIWGRGNAAHISLRQALEEAEMSINDGSYFSALKAVQIARREALAMQQALEPFAQLAEWISANRPDYDSDAHEVQIEGWPYTLGVGQLRFAKRVLKT